jgi:PAS domain S-box-containing protein
MSDQNRPKEDLIAELKLSNDLLKALSEAQDQYISGSDIRPLFEVLLKNIISLTESKYGFIGEVLYAAEGAPFLKTYAVTNIAWNDATQKYYDEYSTKGMEFFNLKTLFGSVLATGMSVISNAPSTDPRSGGLPEGHPPMHAFLGMPIHHGGDLCGMVGIANRTGGYDEKLIEYLHPFLVTCGTLIEARRVAEGRRQAEDKLRESERRLNTILENVGAAIFIKDTQYLYTYVNHKVCDIFGRTSEEILGKSDDMFFSEASVEEIMRSDRPVIEQGKTVRREEIALTSSDGMPHTYWTVKLPLLDSTGMVSGLCGISTDITDRIETERRLRESEDQFRSIFEHANDGIMMADIENKRQLEANKAMCDMLGYTRNEIMNLDINDIHPKEYLHSVTDIFERQVRGEISMAQDIPMLRKDGSVFYADINAGRVTIGGKDCLIGIFRDISERKRAEEELRERERQLAESQRIAHIGSWEHNLKTNKVVWSDELFLLLGLDPKKDPGDFRAFFNSIHPDDQPVLKKAIDETVKTGKPFSVDYRYLLPDGKTSILHAQAELIPDEAGDMVVLSGTGQDITERKLAEEKIRQSEEFVRSILDTVDEGFIVIDRDYRILTANKAYCGQVSMHCYEVIGKHCYEISHKISRPCYEEGEECAVRYVFATGKPHAVSHKHTDSDGHVLYVETKGFPIKDASGNVTSVIETINNITEKHLLEEERLKTQKLESIGTLAGGIAHDFNNLLQGVFGFISMAKMSLDQGEKSWTMLEQAERALHMSVNLTSQLLTFSKGGKPVKKRISLTPVIENAVKFALSGSHTEYQIKSCPGLWQVEADEGQLGQVIQNIVLNSDQAMPLGGRINIAVRNVHAHEKGVPQTLMQGDYVEISIKDSGIGIPERFLSRIFDPYFTTKEKGSGLGLATSYSIIKNHNGLIDVQSEAGKGSTFTIYLPSAGAAEAEAPSSAVTPAGRLGRVLVMDDEEIVRMVSGELIRSLGHEVDFAEHGVAAIEKYQQALSDGKPFDIVILDLTVRGGMGGEETIRKMRAIDPAIKAVVSSGYSDGDIVSNYREHGFSAFLQKPYEVKGLQDIINSMFE